MEPQDGHCKQKWQAQSGGHGGDYEAAVVHKPEGDNLHLESVLSGHAAENTFLQGSVNNWPQDAEVPREDAGIVLDTVVFLPAVNGMEGAHRAWEKDSGVWLHCDFFGGSSTLLQSCQNKDIINKKRYITKLYFHSVLQIISFWCGM